MVVKVLVGVVGVVPVLVMDHMVVGVVVLVVNRMVGVVPLVVDQL